jgi:hypothetical protein
VSVTVLVSATLSRVVTVHGTDDEERAIAAAQDMLVAIACGPQPWDSEYVKVVPHTDKPDEVIEVAENGRFHFPGEN